MGLGKSVSEVCFFDWFTFSVSFWWILDLLMLSMEKIALCSIFLRLDFNCQPRLNLLVTEKPLKNLPINLRKIFSEKIGHLKSGRDIWMAFLRLNLFICSGVRDSPLQKIDPALSIFQFHLHFPTTKLLFVKDSKNPSCLHFANYMQMSQWQFIRYSKCYLLYICGIFANALWWGHLNLFCIQQYSSLYCVNTI